MSRGDLQHRWRPVATICAPRLRAGAALTAIALMFAALPVEARICRVSTAGSPSANGATWAQALSLQGALADRDCTELWLRAGRYLPGTQRADSFLILPGVSLYGGFAGTETTRGQRDPATHRVVLSGDIDANDVTDAHGGTRQAADIRGDNSQHVLLVDGASGGLITIGTEIDGLTISGGDGTSGGFQLPGAGLYCDGAGDGNGCNPTLRDVLFAGNRASRGGAMYNDGGDRGGSSPLLERVTFSGNHAASGGGAMYNRGENDGWSWPQLINVSFSGNSAGTGGAIHNAGSGGLASVVLTNVTLAGNTAAQRGGALYNDAGGDGASDPTLTNVILWGNAAGDAGPEVHNTGGALPTISHSIVAGSGGAWPPALGFDGGGNLDADPRLTPLGDHGGNTPTRVLLPGSAALNAGSDSACPDTDQRGVMRRQGGSHCDIGAVERMPGDGDGIFADGFD